MLHYSVRVRQKFTKVYFNGLEFFILNKYNLRGIFYYFKSYIRYDYYKRKCFNISPDYNELLDSAFSAGVSDIDIQQLFEILNVERPQVLKTN